MKREISKTSVAVVCVAILLVLAAAAAWMWRAPAAFGGGSPTPGTPESATASKERGRQMREGFMAAHRRGKQTGGGPAQAGSDTQ